MRGSIRLVFLFLLMSRCGPKEPEKVAIPPNILKADKLADLLVDFSMAESAASMNIKNLPVQKIDSVYAFDPLTDQKIRKGQYDSSIQFYSAYPYLYKSVYDSVLVKLSEIKSARAKVKGPLPSK
jgi:hypothetical protein